MARNNKNILTKWLSNIIHTRTVWNLQLKHQWIPVALMYKYYLNKANDKAMPKGAFSRAIDRIGETSIIASNVFTCKRRIDRNGQKILFILIIEKAISVVKFDNYSVFTGDFLFTTQTSSSSSSNSSTVVLQPFSTEDASTAPTIKDNMHTAKEKVDPPSHLTDPLLLLAEVAASPPSNSTNYINPNDQNRNNSTYKQNQQQQQ
jgi:hypothetical protein